MSIAVIPNNWYWVRIRPYGADSDKSMSKWIPAFFGPEGFETSHVRDYTLSQLEINSLIEEPHA